MKAQWWSWVLGLLCMPAEALLNEFQALQKPSAIFQAKVNSSITIMCSTSLVDPLTLSLRRQFIGKENHTIVYLSLENGVIKKTTPAPRFKDRIHINPDPQGHGLKHGFTLQLSLLALEDTDLYYCHWTYADTGIDSLSSNGTVIIVRESLPQDHCPDPTLDLTFIALSVTALTIILSLVLCAIIYTCGKFRKKLKPARAPKPSRPNRPVPPRHICHQQRPNHFSYLVTYGNRSDFQGHPAMNSAGTRLMR